MRQYLGRSHRFCLIVCARNLRNRILSFSSMNGNGVMQVGVSSMPVFASGFDVATNKKAGHEVRRFYWLVELRGIEPRTS